MMQLREHRNARVDKIMKVGRSKQALCKEVISLLSEYFMEMNVMSDWGTLSLIL